MSRRFWARGLACLCGLVLTASLAAAQEKKPAEDPKKAESKKPEPPKADKPAAAPGEKQPAGEMGGMDPEVMKRLMEYGTPGEGHKHLEPLVGKWDYELKWWMDANAQPQASAGKSETKWILDGRFLQQDVTGPAEEPGGPPFKGLMLFGHDNMKKQYMSIWVDNMGTGAMVGYGTWDEKEQAVKYSGDMPNPMTGQKDQKWRAIAKMDGNDKHIYTMFATGPDGKEFKMMEIMYTRAK